MATTATGFHTLPQNNSLTLAGPTLMGTTTSLPKAFGFNTTNVPQTSLTEESPTMFPTGSTYLAVSGLSMLVESPCAYPTSSPHSQISTAPYTRSPSYARNSTMRSHSCTLFSQRLRGSVQVDKLVPMAKLRTQISTMLTMIKTR